MRRVLVAVDAVDRARRSLKYLLSDMGASDLYVVLLNAQPRPRERQTHGLFSEEIRSRLTELGHSMCEPVAARLSEAGVPHRVRVELDDTVAAIVRCARDEQCTQILISAPPLGPVGRAFLRVTRCMPGSIACQIIHMTDIPVTVVH